MIIQNNKMVGNPKGEVVICFECNIAHNILRGTKCVCACGQNLFSKEYIVPKTEDVPVLIVYECSDGGIGCKHPENDKIPLYKLIGFLEVYLMTLKEKAIVSDFTTDEEE